MLSGETLVDRDRLAGGAVCPVCRTFIPVQHAPPILEYGARLGDLGRERVAIMKPSNRHERRTIIVRGCGEIGSAIAHALHRAGFAVVLIDEVDPSWARRGMTFTDAWY